MVLAKRPGRRTRTPYHFVDRWGSR